MNETLTVIAVVLWVGTPCGYVVHCGWARNQVEPEIVLGLLMFAPLVWAAILAAAPFFALWLLGRVLRRLVPDRKLIEADADAVVAMLEEGRG